MPPGLLSVGVLGGPAVGNLTSGLITPVAALGVQQMYAADHWRHVAETRATNLPDVDHAVADISQIDPRRILAALPWHHPWHVFGIGSDRRAETMAPRAAAIARSRSVVAC